ncbi:hypothetical protein ACFO4O_07885 [Glaciecola siphonariae]|uniref:Type II secretion system protein GspC N-terminal domain-containing protein n=1 Tax=Glaciecola siphonariae TaxID=521012 RepID=A0ABV9LW33_9ALTE
MIRVWTFILVVLFISLGLGLWHGYETVPQQSKTNTVIPSVQSSQQQQWVEKIAAFAQFAPPAPAPQEDTDANTPDASIKKSGIEQASLVGIFIEQEASAIVLTIQDTESGASQPKAKRFKVGQTFDQQWRLQSINTTYITWVNQSSEEILTMHLFTPSTAEN